MLHADSDKMMIYNDLRPESVSRQEWWVQIEQLYPFPLVAFSEHHGDLDADDENVHEVADDDTITDLKTTPDPPTILSPTTTTTREDASIHNAFDQIFY